MLKNKEKKEKLKAKLRKLLNKGKEYAVIAAELKLKIEEVKALAKESRGE